MNSGHEFSLFDNSLACREKQRGGDEKRVERHNGVWE